MQEMIVTSINCVKLFKEAGEDLILAYSESSSTSSLLLSLFSIDILARGDPVWLAGRQNPVTN